MFITSRTIPSHFCKEIKVLCCGFVLREMICLGWCSPITVPFNTLFIMGAHDQAIAAGQPCSRSRHGQRGCRPARVGELTLRPSLLFPDDYRRAIDYLRQAVAFFDGPRRRERFGFPNLPAVLSVPSSLGAMPSWARSLRAGPSGKKGSRLPRRLLTPGA